MKKRTGTLCLLLAGLLLLASCGAIPGMSNKSDADKQYSLGDKITTVFMEYTPNSASAADTYEGYTPAEGNQLLIVDMTVKNTEDYALPMGLYDFQIQWGSGDDDFGYPLEKYMDAQLEDEYEIPVGESVQGLLVYEVPAGETEFALCFLEVYENDKEGDAYFTYFTVA